MTKTKTNNFDLQQIRDFRAAGRGWSYIARYYSCDRKTLSIWKREINYNDNLTTPTQAELERAILSFIQGKPLIGERIVAGHLFGLGLHVKRRLLRATLLAIDGENRKNRWFMRITRGKYYVPRPMYLIHVDGNHKLEHLIGLVINGGIDGYSRKVLWLWCFNNNSSRAVLGIFFEACEVFGYPEFMRTDEGGENVASGKLLSAVRNEARHLAGPSPQNQRIERHWLDAYSNCICYYYDLFLRFTVDNNMNGKGNPKHQWIIQYLFLPRINADLTRVRIAWNNHKLYVKGKGSFSPEQRFSDTFVENRALHVPPEDIDRIQRVIDGLQENYGQRKIAAFACLLTQEEQEYFESQIIPFTLEDFEYESRIKTAFSLWDDIISVRNL